MRTAVPAFVILTAVALVAREMGLLDKIFVFFPDKRIVATPADVGLAFDDVSFAAEDGVDLHGWFVPGETDVTLVWFHGNAGNISHRLENLRLMHDRLGVGVFIFDYRGYGQSEGSPSERGTYRDADAAIQYVRERVGEAGRLVLFGRSLGCAVAVEMATRHEADALILESPFTSIPAMARRSNPILSRLMLGQTMVKSRYDSISKMPSVGMPLMVLHGDRDSTVPMDMAEELFEAHQGPKRFYVIEGADHNDTYLVGGEPYFQALGEFLAGLQAG